ncbi:hypothetical protein Cgig2_028332 [Carnegiea gigantea]|uniref:Uncharacterized protein n=1 Tax=Carnegiea gigantea TaxID=171969 RepID=A0A9Q1KJR2_9CARY|nr:hypothetical protein Cgig2_028332 [Carnegiea gigantea]
MYDSLSGCDHFEWVSDSLSDKVRSMVVSLIVSNETLVQENEHLQKMKEEAASDRDAMKRLREKNSRLKMQLIDYQMRERKALWGLLLLFDLIKRDEVWAEQILVTEKQFDDDPKAYGVFYIGSPTFSLCHSLHNSLEDFPNHGCYGVVIIIKINPPITVIFIIITI